MALNKRALAWLEHLKAWQQSGSRQDLYCEANGLNPKTFSNWKRRLRVHLPDLPTPERIYSLPTKPIVPLVAVALSDELDGMPLHPTKQFELDFSRSQPVLAAKSSGISLSVREYQISVQPDFDPGTLRRLLVTLGEAR